MFLTQVLQRSHEKYIIFPTRDEKITNQEEYDIF